jgi:hypothetical protein
MVELLLENALLAPAASRCRRAQLLLQGHLGRFMAISKESLLDALRCCRNGRVEMVAG